MIIIYMAAITTLIPMDEALLDRVASRIYSVPEYSIELGDLAIWYWYVPDVEYRTLLNENGTISGR